jgi:ATP-dependent DNA helicase RecG
VDEQHRFGVMQRASLREKGGTPHLLVMSATPIPRSLALTLYGDLDISVLDELPPGRQVVTTSRVEPQYRGNTYAFVRRQVEQGHQVFVICPLIQESDVLQSRSAVQEFEKLSSEIFPDLRLKLLHGRMGSKEKENVMGSFYKHEVDILVSTAVIEVGIDNPNATVILIEGAERFGLAQLHQLRGRVGRGEHSSYCFLMYDNPSVESRERLEVLESLNDGFAVAEADLKFRGPGDFFGVRQSGLPDLRMAKLSDQDLLTAARQQAAKLIGTGEDANAVINMDLLTEIEHYSSLMIGETS